jgi:hypothetical protein
MLGFAKALIQSRSALRRASFHRLRCFAYDEKVQTRPTPGFELLLLIMLLTLFGLSVRAADSPAFLGFDRNDYPGDDHLRELHKTFAFTGYWLNNPPGTKTNTWVGKRNKLESAGFGFLVLFNGRLYRELRAHAAERGTSDAQTAVKAARREGFPEKTTIFLDQEEGGRLLPEQKAYLFAWIDGVTQAGFRAGVYCSGMPAQEDGGKTVITAEDIRQNAGQRKISYWVTNDACPPSQGCVKDTRAAAPEASGIDFADIWQFAQSPQRREIAANCPGYNKDGNCYATKLTSYPTIHVDLNTANSRDPSHGRRSTNKK